MSGDSLVLAAGILAALFVLAVMGGKWLSHRARKADAILFADAAAVPEVMQVVGTTDVLVRLTPAEVGTLIEACAETFRAGVLQDYAAANTALSKLDKAHNERSK